MHFERVVKLCPPFAREVKKNLTFPKIFQLTRAKKNPANPRIRWVSGPPSFRKSFALRSQRPQSLVTQVLPPA
jgi:hypothetical protein